MYYARSLSSCDLQVCVCITPLVEQGGNNDDGDDKPPGDPTTDEFGNVDAIGGASSDGGTGTVSSAHKKTGVALSKGVKKAWVG